MTHDRRKQSANRSVRLTEIARDVKRSQRRNRADVTSGLAVAVGTVVAAAILFLPLSSWMLMLAFGIGHSVFPVIPPIGYVAAIKVYVAVMLTKIATGTRKSKPS